MESNLMRQITIAAKIIINSTLVIFLGINCHRYNQCCQQKILLQVNKIKFEKILSRRRMYLILYILMPAYMCKYKEFG